MNTKFRTNLQFVIIAITLVFVYQAWLTSSSTASIPYSEFQKLLSEQKIANVVITNDQLKGEFIEPRKGKRFFLTNRVDPTFANELDVAGTNYSALTENRWLSSLLFWVLPVLLIYALWVFVLRRHTDQQGLGSFMGVGKSRAKVYIETDTGVTFEDVAGVDEAKMELQEVVAFLTDKTKYSKLGAHVPKGILLVGPPGTGKTLLARAVAGEANVPFFSISGSEFVEMFVGVGAARVRDLFKQARASVPCIVFIDELDALGRARGKGAMGGHDEKEQTLNQLLSELDGFDPRGGIVLLAATNRPEILDPALMRAGRFDRQVVVDRPDRVGRVAILKVHMRNIKASSNADPEQIAGITPGFTGADLANLVNEAAIFATRRNADAVELEDFTNAVERIVAGSERKSRLISSDERRRVAYHEMGHALVAASIPGMDPVHKVSIIPRSIGSLGYTLQRPTDDRFLITSEELIDRMVVLLAGRASEDITFGQISTGAADDLAKVTDIARQFVTRFGMSETLGQSVLEQSHTSYLGETELNMMQRNYSDDTAREVDLAVRNLIDQAYDVAKRILSEQSDVLKTGAQLLMERETLTPDDFAPLRQSDASLISSQGLTINREKPVEV